ncbi:type IV pilin protein [Candidatus Avelusimicrobium aviculae]|uniref:type IV pilin protein n=1 Tax=Candidatus Avelusimicrobium aviculae TaxID=3416206 RepID=UPI003D0AD246
MKTGFTLVELLVVILIIGVLSSIAIPYYFNAVEAARNTEAILLWGRTKNFYRGRQMDEEAARRLEEKSNREGKLKHYNIAIVCRNEPGKEVCWEADFLQKEPRHAEYKLTTTDNFLHLACIGINNAGKDFCLSRTTEDNKTEIDGQEAYIIRF